MEWNRQLCIIIYSLILIQCTATLVLTYMRVKHSSLLYIMNVSHILTILWLVFGMYEIQSRTTEELLFAVRLTLFPMSFISGVWLIFTLFYANLIHDSRRWIYVIVLAPQLITYLPVISNKYFHLAILYKDIADPGSTVWGPFMLVNFNTSYAYLIISVLILLYYGSKAQKHQRSRIFLFALTPLLPFIVSFLAWNKLIPSPGFDLTPVTFSVMLLMQSLATFRFKAFDQLHHGAVDVFMNTEEALFILNPHNQIVNVNTMAEDEFGSLLMAGDSASILPFLGEIKNRALNHSDVDSIIKAINRGSPHHQTQLTIIDQQSTMYPRYYDVYLKTIKDNNNKTKGKLISFKNRTEQSKALLEKEHRRIFKTIHDGLSNLVNVISMNLEYVLGGSGTEEDNLHCIETAFTTNNQLRFELRKILDELVPLDIEKNGLLNALESLFKRVTGTGLQLDFTPVALKEKYNRDLTAGLVVYSTCLEGINNAMHNGKARQVSIVLMQADKALRLMISDDGVGCDTIVPGNGLKNITARVEAIGGKILFESVPNEGFSITAEIPLERGTMND